MNDYDKAIMHLGQAGLCFHRAGMLEESAKIQEQIQRLEGERRKQATA